MKKVKVDEFKCIGLTIQHNDQFTREVKKRVQAGRSSLREVSG